MAGYLNIGDSAPSFSLQNQNGEMVNLEDFKGKKVVLYFYPKDNTSGCTREANDFKEHMPAILAKNAVVLGVSKDSVKSHKGFAEKNCLPFELLSDPDNSVIDAYGAWQLKVMCGRENMGIVRTSYVINEEGKIENVYQVKKVDGHVAKLVSEL